VKFPGKFTFQESEIPWEIYFPALESEIPWEIHFPEIDKGKCKQTITCHSRDGKLKLLRDFSLFVSQSTYPAVSIFNYVGM